MRLIYLILALSGVASAVFLAENWSLSGPLFRFNWNLMIIWLAFFSFAGHECRLRKDYLPLISFVVAAVFGLGAGLPLYLFLRSRPME